MDSHHFLPVPPRQHLRRRSADVGGLHLAMENTGHGQGWVGDSGDVTKFAELLVDMYTSTLHAVNEQGSDFIPPELSRETRSRLIESMETWDFEPHKLPEEERLACTLILFEALFRIEGMEEAIGVSMEQITPFVYHLRRIYRFENSYHNFEHALDVLQAVYSYLRAAGMVPPLSLLYTPGRKWACSRQFDSGALITSLGLHELFVLYVAAIGHDVGHPGFTNTFMKNASTPLSEVYDGKSALEQMHSQLLLRVMRYHGLGVVLDHPKTGFCVRRLLWETILATDMSVHELFMKNLEGVINGQVVSLFSRQSIICQTLMKCADISNPSRPYHVAKHWASALMEEWTSQALYEKFLDLPTTVQSDDSPINEANAQVFFISTFAKPLLDLTSQAIPEMKVFTDQCATNLRTWKKRIESLKTNQNERDNQSSTTPRHPDDFMTAFPLTLPPAHRTLHLEDQESTPPWSSPCVPYSRSSESSSTTSDILSPLPPPASPWSSASEGHAAIRAAGKLGIRKQRSLNRNSWSPSACSGCPPPPPPPPPPPTATSTVVRTLLVTPPVNVVNGVNGVNKMGMGPIPPSRIVVRPILLREA
ncbi:3',5'-cyclic-nucleotide phosphodiesterase regA [Termitomyces sp. J132]|nr:3',5'-cyclic-nucleotide phosphodiesterase regA [Termitomyces sp. J132]